METTHKTLKLSGKMVTIPIEQEPLAIHLPPKTVATGHQMTLTNSERDTVATALHERGNQLRKASQVCRDCLADAQQHKAVHTRARAKLANYCDELEAINNLLQGKFLCI